jgi:hypothetical protein
MGQRFSNTFYRLARRSYTDHIAAMSTSAYPAARAVSTRVHEHFARHRTEIADDGEVVLAPLPDQTTIESIIDAAFWTSLRREEQTPPRISLAYLPPESTWRPLMFQRPLPLSPPALTKIAPGVERPGIHLGVWHDNGKLRIWGAARTLPTLCFVVETVAPGLLVVKHRRRDVAAKFVNVAVLEGDRYKVLHHEFSTLPGCPSVLQSLLGFDADSPTSSHSSNVLIKLAVSMREHGRGGALLIVPQSSDSWRESIAHPISYLMEPAFSGLSELLLEEPNEHHRRWREAVSKAVDAVAGLTATDGAAIMSDDCKVFAFGAKIIRRDGSNLAEQVSIVEPAEDEEARIIHPSQLGGTRHLSAAQFVNDQRDSLALVASQDGPFTIFAWSTCDERVYGYRVESLLL